MDVLEQKNYCGLELPAEPDFLDLNRTVEAQQDFAGQDRPEDEVERERRGW